MKTWQPFIVVENAALGLVSSNTHVVVLRVKDCLDMEVFQGKEVECFKEAYELNHRVRVSLSDFIEGKE
jgi:hypothetical protein